MIKLHHHLLIVTCALLLLAACSSAPASAPTSTAPTSAPVAAPTDTPAPTATPLPTATPAPTDTPAPTNAPAQSSGPACLVGNWELANIGDYFASIMAKANTPFTQANQQGNIRLTFGSDGKAVWNANDWKVTLTAQVEGINLNVVVSINGSATADYSATADTITFSNRQSDNLVMSSSVNGQTLFSGTSDQLAAMFGVSGKSNAFNEFPYECSGDTLKYTPPIKNARPVVLQRVP